MANENSESKSAVKFTRGQLVSYQNLSAKDSDTMYVIPDSGSIYLGEDIVGNTATVVVTISASKTADMTIAQIYQAYTKGKVVFAFVPSNTACKVYNLIECTASSVKFRGYANSTEYEYVGNASGWTYSETEVDALVVTTKTNTTLDHTFNEVYAAITAGRPIILNAYLDGFYYRGYVLRFDSSTILFTGIIPFNDYFWIVWAPYFSTDEYSMAVLEIPTLAADTVPKPAGIATVGRLQTAARADHIHPRDTTLASPTVVGGVKPVAKTDDMTTPVGVDDAGALFTNALSDVDTIEGELVELPNAYTLPVATPTTLGGVKPVAKTSEMSSEVGVDSNGRLFTAGTPSTHTQSASTITAGTFAGQVAARASDEANLDNLQLRNVRITNATITAGVTEMNPGEIIFVYE
jgi:hypothetical protein